MSTTNNTGEVLAALYAFASRKCDLVKVLLDAPEPDNLAVQRALGEQTAAIEAHALVSNVLGFLP